MNPKPFWPLNHLAVPVVIFFSKARKRVPRDNHAANFNFVDVFGKGACGRIQQGTAANRARLIYIIFRFLQGRSQFVSAGSSGAPLDGRRVPDAMVGVPKVRFATMPMAVEKVHQGRRHRHQFRTARLRPVERAAA